MRLQAIASMMKAQDVDPTNLEVLLALGVSHTNGNMILLFFFNLYFTVLLVNIASLDLLAWSKFVCCWFCNLEILETY